MLVGQDESERGSRGDGCAGGYRKWFPPRQLRSFHEPGRCGPFPGRVAADPQPRPSRMIYLDYQATTPVAPEVEKAMLPWISDKFANPHSPSKWGREAEAAIEVARKQVERAIGLEKGSVAFTGSATEALNWALKGAFEKARVDRPERNRIITVVTEHAATLDTCEWLAGQGADLTLLPVGADGLLDLDLLKREFDDRVLLVAVMLVNNEIGVLQ